MSSKSASYENLEKIALDNYFPSIPSTIGPLDDSHDLTTIPQFDGNESLDNLNDIAYAGPRTLPPPMGAYQSHPITFTKPNVHDHKTSFTLDRNKQLKKLKKDSNIKDFEIEISPSDKNVNINCSTGFYTKVALPSFQDLAVGHTLPVGDLSVKCHDITNRTDASGATTTTVIMFRMCQNNLSLGGVTIHLHHTTRNIQVQGSALLPDKKLAPVWFVDNVLKERFSQLSESQAYDINTFNRAVGDMVTNHMQKVNTKTLCGGCNVHFSGRSVPELCTNCNMYFHKFKCLNSTNHACISRKRTKSCSTIQRSNHRNNANAHLPPPLAAQRVPTISTLVTTQTATLIDDPIPGNSRAETLVHQTTPSQAHTMDATPIPKPAQTRPYQSTTPQPSTSEPETVAASSIPVAAPTYRIQSSLDPSAPVFKNTSEPPQPNNVKPKSKKAKNALGGEGLELEYARYEVNITQAKIREQETKINDLEFRNRILEARVQELEKKQKQEIYERYFPESGTSQSFQTPAPGSTQTSHNSVPASTCCGITSHTMLSCCSCHNTKCPENSTTAKDKEDIIRDILKQLKALKDNNTELNCKFDTLTDITLPQNLRAFYNKDDCRPAQPTPDLSPTDPSLGGSSQASQSTPNLSSYMEL